MNRDELEITAALTQVNDKIKRYIIRVLDEASGSYNVENPKPINQVEHEVGALMIELGRKLQDRAAERGYVAIEEQSKRLPPKPQIPEF